METAPGAGTLRAAVASKSREMSSKTVRIAHRPSGIVIAAGPLGWGITPFEGNYYIGRKSLRTDGFHPKLHPRAPSVQVRLRLAEPAPARRWTLEQPRVAVLAAQPAVPVHLVSGGGAETPPRAGRRRDLTGEPIVRSRKTPATPRAWRGRSVRMSNPTSLLAARIWTARRPVAARPAPTAPRTAPYRDGRAARCLHGR